MTLREAKRRWSQRRRKYVVGYIGSGNCIYWDASGRKVDKSGRYAASDPMTLKEARALLAKMPSRGAAIFELRPIAIGGGPR